MQLMPPTMQKFREHGCGTMTSPTTLDARIAAALAVNGKTGRDTLAALAREAEATLVAAQELAALENERLLDISNDNPDASDAAIARAERTIARLTAALPKLRARIRDIEADQYAKDWHAAANKLEAERDKLAAELAALYSSLVEQLAALYARIDANEAAIDQLNSQAPYGEQRRLVGAELRARGLQSYSAAQPRLREHLKLPDWHEPHRIAFPPPVPLLSPYVEAMVGLAQAIERKEAGLYSDNWFAAQQYADEQARAERDRVAEIEAKQQAEARRRYEQALLEADYRARTGG
jgi:hypothetical protein